MIAPTIEEILALEVGDLILLGSSERLIRKIKVTTSKRGSKLVFFYFSKKNKSQYPAAFTTYLSTDLLTLLKGVIRKGVPLVKSKEEAALQYSIEANLCGNLSSCKGEEIRKAAKYNLYMDQENSYNFR